MPSSFKSLSLFSSGPHTFHIGTQGRRVVPLSAVAADPSVPGSFESGDIETRITVKGHLAANAPSALWSLRDAIADQAAFETTAGDLTDHHGHTWPDLKLLNVEWDSPLRIGRQHTIAYAATFGTTEG